MPSATARTRVVRASGGGARTCRRPASRRAACGEPAGDGGDHGDTRRAPGPRDRRAPRARRRRAAAARRARPRSSSRRRPAPTPGPPAAQRPPRSRRRTRSRPADGRPARGRPSAGRRWSAVVGQHEQPREQDVARRDAGTSMVTAAARPGHGLPVVGAVAREARRRAPGALVEAGRRAARRLGPHVARLRRRRRRAARSPPRRSRRGPAPRPRSAAGSRPAGGRPPRTARRR